MSTLTFDLVVWGGTLPGVLAAKTAARNGLSAVILEPSQHLGGMATGGLNLTDLGQAGPVTVGGLTRDFYDSGGLLYGIAKEDWLGASAWKGPALGSKHALALILADPNITVITGARLAEAPIVKNGVRITGLVTTAGTFVARSGVYVDASYEGSLLVPSGCMVTYGREGRNQFGEYFAGFRGPAMLRLTVDPANTNGRRFRHVDPFPPGWPTATSWDATVAAGPTSALDGRPDNMVNPYCFRLHITDRADRIPWPKPPIYNALDYEFFIARQVGHAPPVGVSWAKRVFGFGRNHLWQPASYASAGATLWEINSGQAASINWKGGADTYPTASYAEQRRLSDLHFCWQAGLIWAAAHETRIGAYAVPPRLNTEVQALGLAPDEFVDDCYIMADGTRVPGWTPQLYVRAGLRLCGIHHITQADIFVAHGTTIPDPVCFANYGLDRHSGRNYTDATGQHVYCEGRVLRVTRTNSNPDSAAYDPTIPPPEDLTNEDGDVDLPGGYWDATQGCNVSYNYSPGSGTVDPYTIVHTYAPVIGAFPVPMRALLPQPTQCIGLVVAWCASMTDVPWCGFRMEPTGGMVGEAAGAIAVACARTGTLPHRVPYAAVRDILLAQGARLDWSFVPSSSYHCTPAEKFV